MSEKKRKKPHANNRWGNFVFVKVWLVCNSRWWFQIFFYFHPYLTLFGEMIQVDYNFFQMGCNHHLEIIQSGFCFVNSFPHV